MNPSPIRERMSAALTRLRVNWGGKRKPKAFYLNAADYHEFMSTPGQRETVTLPFGNRPPVMRTDFAFDGVPVRESKEPLTTSKLYDQTQSARNIPEAVERKRNAPEVHWTKADKAKKLDEAKVVFEVLDAESRRRALDDRESFSLEYAIRVIDGQSTPSRRPHGWTIALARSGVKRD